MLDTIYSFSRDADSAVETAAWKPSSNISKWFDGSLLHLIIFLVGGWPTPLEKY